MSLFRYVDDLLSKLTHWGQDIMADIFQCIFLNEYVCNSIKIALEFVPKGPINNIPALVQKMAWRRAGDKPLYEPMMVTLPTHICVTRLQWVDSVAGRLHKFLVVHICNRIAKGWDWFSQVIAFGIVLKLLYSIYVYVWLYLGIKICQCSQIVPLCLRYRDCTSWIIGHLLVFADITDSGIQMGLLIYLNLHRLSVIIASIRQCYRMKHKDGRWLGNPLFCTV